MANSVLAVITSNSCRPPSDPYIPYPLETIS
jgi:hypothetical protein